MSYLQSLISRITTWMIIIGPTFTVQKFGNTLWNKGNTVLNTNSLKRFHHKKITFSMLFVSINCAENSSTVYRNSFSIKRYLNFRFRFYVLCYISSTIILFICRWFLLSFSIVFRIINMINWM